MTTVENSGTQLDNTRIAIRERSHLELLDLALRVIRAHGWPLIGAFLAGAVPAALLNAWLLSGSLEIDDDVGFPAGYLWYMLLLVIWELPLATAPLTVYLGRSLFAERPRPREIALQIWQSLPQLIWYQVILRALLIPWVITWFLLFVSWPYLNEIILLERNPMFSRRKDRMTTPRRRRVLHAGYQSDLFTHWLTVVCFGSLLFGSVWLASWVMCGLLVADWQWGLTAYSVYFPLALWLVVGFFAVARFLAYLNLRICREGWEVELLMRAEGNRITSQLT